jgi:hypothetical protein
VLGRVHREASVTLGAEQCSLFALGVRVGAIVFMVVIVVHPVQESIVVAAPPCRGVF